MKSDLQNVVNRPSVGERYMGTLNPVKFTITSVDEKGYIKAVTDSGKCGTIAFTPEMWSSWIGNLISKIEGD